MGRNREAYWDGRRALRAYRTSKAFNASCGFDREAVIQGARGRVRLEPVTTPRQGGPRTAWRVLARWTGALPAGSVITVDGRRLVVLSVLPMDGRRTAAQFLCREEDAWA